MSIRFVDVAVGCRCTIPPKLFTKKKVWLMLQEFLRNLEGPRLVWLIGSSFELCCRANNSLTKKKILPHGLSAVCWAIWRTRNSVCFDKKRIKSPTEIVCMMCSFLIYWAGMLKDGLKQQVIQGEMIQGAKILKMVALSFHKQDVQSQTNDDQQLIPFTG